MEKSQFVKHPAAIAWNKWLESEEGFKCQEGNANGQYLQNRLWHAFMAGYEHRAN